MVTTQFFAMKINRYMHDHGITPRDAREGRGEELPQRRAQPERVAAQAVQRGGDPRVADAQLPAHAVHVLLAGRGCRRRSCCAAPSARARYTDRPVHLRAVDDAHPPVGARSRCSRRGCRSTAGTRPTVDAARAVLRAGRHRAVRRRRRAGPGQRVGRRDHAHGRDRAVRRRRAGGDDRRRARPRSAAACRSTPTVG